MITDKVQSWILQLLPQMTSAVASVKNICPFALAVIQNWNMTFKNNEIFTQRKVLAYYE